MQPAHRDFPHTDVDIFAKPGRPRISRRTIHLCHAGGLREFPRKSVLASTRTDDQNLHERIRRRG